MSSRDLYVRRIRASHGLRPRGEVKVSDLRALPVATQWQLARYAWRSRFYKPMTYRTRFWTTRWERWSLIAMSGMALIAAVGTFGGRK